MSSREPHSVSYVQPVTQHYASLSAMFNLLHSITNQELFEKHLCNQSNPYENADDFRYEEKPSCASAKSTPFAVNKDEWDTKEDIGKFMKMHCMYCGMPKGTCPAEAMSNSEKIKTLALAVIKVRLSEGISQSVIYSVSQSVDI